MITDTQDNQGMDQDTQDMIKKALLMRALSGQQDQGYGKPLIGNEQTANLAQKAQGAFNTFFSGVPPQQPATQDKSLMNILHAQNLMSEMRKRDNPNSEGFASISDVPDVPGMQKEISMKGNRYIPTYKTPSIDFGEKEKQFGQKEWDKIVHDMSSARASSRSVLGIAAQGNLKADRALSTLNNPKLTPQDMYNVTQDIESIYQGGAPTDVGVNKTSYDTIINKIANFKQYLLAHPSESTSPQIKQHLKNIIGELKNTNTKGIQDFYDYTEKAQPQIINQFKDQWQGMRAPYDQEVASYVPGQELPPDQSFLSKVGGFFSGMKGNQTPSFLPSESTQTEKSGKTSKGIPYTING